MAFITINGEEIDINSGSIIHGEHFNDGIITAGGSYRIQANNCTNFTISALDNDSDQGSFKVEATHCDNFAINSEKNLVIIVCAITASITVLFLFMVFIWLYLRRNRRASPEEMVDTSQAPVASAMNLEFQDPPERFSNLKRYFTKC